MPCVVICESILWVFFVVSIIISITDFNFVLKIFFKISWNTATNKTDMTDNRKTLFIFKSNEVFVVIGRTKADFYVRSSGVSCPVGLLSSSVSAGILLLLPQCLYYRQEVMTKTIKIRLQLYWTKSSFKTKLSKLNCCTFFGISDHLTRSWKCLGYFIP